MDRPLGRYSETLFTILRVVAGVTFCCHGAQKLFGAFNGHVVPFASLAALAGVIEFVGGVLIAVGFFTRAAALVASGEMASAYFIQHAPRGPLPILNGGELATLYCFLWLYVSAHGPGRWSLDAIRRRRT